jgi:phage tail tube protein FII
VGCGGDRATLDIAGGQETIDASVVINGELSGTMTKFGDDGARFAKSVKKGKMRVEVKKNGYVPFQDTVAIQQDEGEHYLFVTLTLEGKDKSGS